MKRLILALLLLPASAAVAADITPAAVIESMNAYRAEAHLPPLREDSRLDAVAADRMRDMEEREYWAHESPDGRSPFVWLLPNGYTYRNAGENLACGFETNELLMTGWMESKGHRENILSPDYADCGVAVIDGATTGRAAGKSIVVMFGRSMSGINVPVTTSRSPR
ncbi:MAG: CAP domain-containing protein [Thermoanaerobaculia bacterium]